MNRVWQALSRLCAAVGDIGALPPEVVDATEYTTDKILRADPVSASTIRDALDAWKPAEVDNPVWFHIRSIGFLVQHLGFFAGRRLGLPDMQALLFGDWLALVISGHYQTHANEQAVAALDQIAGKAVFADQAAVGRAYLGSDFWSSYQVGVKAAFDAIQHRFLDTGWRTDEPDM